MNEWLIALMGVIATVGGAGGIWSLWTVRATRKKLLAEANGTVADTVRVLISGAADLVEPLKRELAEARATAADTRADVAELRRTVLLVERRLRRLIDLVRDPEMTMDRLRMTVGPEPDSDEDTRFANRE